MQPSAAAERRVGPRRRLSRDQPALAELLVDGDHVSLIRTLPLRTPDGPLSGLVPPGGVPTFDLAGRRLPPDPPASIPKAWSP